MQVELGHSDLFSLEPVDEDNRKLSDKKVQFKEFIEWQNNNIEQQGLAVDINDNADEEKSEDEDLFRGRNISIFYNEF